MPVRKYQTKPKVRDAVQWLGTIESLREIKEFAGHWVVGGEHGCQLYVTTPNGGIPVDHLDWIVKAGEGDYYPVKPKVFEETYDTV